MTKVSFVRLTWSSQSLINPNFSTIIVVGIAVGNGVLSGCRFWKIISNILLSRHLTTSFLFFFFFFLRLSVFGLFLNPYASRLDYLDLHLFYFFYLIVLFLYFLINIITMIFKNYPIMPYFSNKNIFFMVILSIILWRIYTNLICRFKKNIHEYLMRVKYMFFYFLMYYIYIYIKKIFINIWWE